MTRPLIHRLAFSIALTLSAASLVAVAAESQDRTDIEVFANGSSEKVTLLDLKAGETRQLYSEAGTLVTATRTAESLELDIGGDKTSIKMVEPGDLDDAEIDALIAAETGSAEPGTRRVVRLHRDVQHADGKAQAEGHRKVIMIGGKDGDVHHLGGDHAEHAELMLKHHGEPGAKHVIVKRTLAKPAEGQAK